MFNGGRLLLTDRRNPIAFPSLLTRDVKADALKTAKNGKVNREDKLLCSLKGNSNEDVFRQVDLQFTIIVMLLKAQNLTKY